MIHLGHRSPAAGELVFLPDAQWHQLVACLVAAAHAPASPHAAAADGLAGLVCPQSCRADVLAVAQPPPENWG